MKLINYNYGGIVGHDTYYRGKIQMTEAEWIDAFKYLRSYKVQKSFLPSYPWTNTQLIEDAERSHPYRKNRVIAIRVPMTEKLVEKYGLKGYKRVNYFIEITPN